MTEVMSDISGKKPRVIDARVAGLRLTQEERSVVGRMDGRLSVEELVGATGLAAERVEQIVSKLALGGAVDLGSEARIRTAPTLPDLDDGGTTSLADFAAVLGMDPSAFAEKAPPAAPEPARPARPVLRKIVRRRTDEMTAPLVAATAEPAATLEELPEAEQVNDEELPQLEDVKDEDERPASAKADAEPCEVEPSKSNEETEDEVARAVAERNYRQVYESRWHALPVDTRVGAARVAKGADLFALCFDPDPRVISAVLENHTVGLDHVRMIAFYHRTNTGLEILARRQEWIRDVQVERRLLRNPMIGEIVLGRVMGPKRLFPTYKIAIDRDVPELSRIKCRGMVKQKWATSAAEERADLLVRTEGRCLTIMAGCTFDAKTTSILCGRPINSVMFVQSIAKFGGSPPALLAHLFKQPFVRKNVPLKKLLLAHPNMPGEVKRSI